MFGEFGLTLVGCCREDEWSAWSSSLRGRVIDEIEALAQYQAKNESQTHCSNDHGEIVGASSSASAWHWGVVNRSLHDPLLVPRHCSLPPWLFACGDDEGQ